MLLDIINFVPEHLKGLYADIIYLHPITVNLLDGSRCYTCTGDSFGKSPGLILSYNECAFGNIHLLSCQGCLLQSYTGLLEQFFENLCTPQYNLSFGDS